MAETKNKSQVLDFFYDDEDACALTALVNDVRFHIMVDPKDLRKSSDKNLYYQYLDKIGGLREAEEKEEDIADRRQRSLSEKKNKNKKGKETEKKSADRDSAVDIGADDDDEEYVDGEDEEDGEDMDQDAASAQVELRNWVLDGFEGVFKASAPADREPEESTLYDWYHGPTYFYSLGVANGQLEPEILETRKDLEERIEKLVPRMKMPKYITQMDVPWLNSKDLTVQSEVEVPEPAHPGEVKDAEGNTYFFKPVVKDQPNPVKREISILQKLAKLADDGKVDIKVPRILGFVSYESSKTEAMGFLLNSISDARPLTKLLDPSVDESLRKSWKEKSEQYVKQLHENDIIWGDAKADNFIVDGDDELWIIDFGGSYTEGWVDPELQETEEGDDMGLEKVQAALEDPEKNTFDPAISGSGSGRKASNDLEATVSDVQQTASDLFVTEKKPVVGENETEAGDKRKRDDEVDEGENKKLKVD